MSFEIVLEGVDARFRCPDGKSVLDAMMAVGKRVLPIGCRSGGCGVCRVQVVAGRFESGTMSAAHVSTKMRAAGIALACQIYPRSNLSLRALGLSSVRNGDGGPAASRPAEPGNRGFGASAR